VKLLLLGCNGQVGWELRRSLAPLGDVLACGVDPRAGIRIDLADLGALRSLLVRERPDVIVNAAAYTAVDRAETEPEQARRINATAVGALAAHAASTSALLVHYSTDYVFDGSGSHARDESAPTAPLSAYGRSKLEGEQAIQASACRHLILRTSWVHGARGENFAGTMLKLAAERDSLKVVADQIGAPTGADLLADVTAQLIPRVLNRPADGGLYHCVAAGETSWYDYARHVVDWARARGHVLRLAPEGLLPVSSVDHPRPARRPLNSRLSTHKLRSTFGIELPPWEQGVDRMLAERPEAIRHGGGRSGAWGG
jgi:dTDP-4-dehydrorhamnose reductase